MKAINEGRKRYNTGKPCKRGHLADRFTATMNCIRCIKEYRLATNRRINQNNLLESMGYVDVTVKVKPQDVQFIRDIAEMTHTGREEHLKLVGDYCRALGMAMQFDGI